MIPTSVTRSVYALPFLPKDVWIQVVSHLADDALSLACLSQTCRRLERIVKAYSTLYPQILSILVANSSVDDAGMHASIRTSLDKKVRFTALQSWNCVKCLMCIVPDVCFAGAIRHGLIGASKLKGSFAYIRDRSHSTSFFRTSAEYDYSQLHKQGHLSLAEDCVDFLFRLSNKRVHFIKSISWESNAIGLRLNEVLSAALENTAPSNRMFHVLRAQVTQRQRIRDERSRMFQAAAKRQSFVYPQRRHVAERMFIIGNWTEIYSLQFLRQCQRSIIQELREQRLHAALRTRTNMSMSPYSCLSEKYISGHLANEHGMAESCALKFTIGTLQEIEFAHRNTMYTTLKSTVLRRCDSVESIEHACCICFWSANKEVLTLISHFLDQGNDLDENGKQIQDRVYAQTGQPQTRTCRFFINESSNCCGAGIKRRKLSYFPEAIDCDDVTNVVKSFSSLNCEELGDRDFEEDSEWCVVENHNDGEKFYSKMFLADDAFDVTSGAVELREWSLFFYACKIYAQLDESVSVIDIENGIPIASLDKAPKTISSRLRDMLCWLSEMEMCWNGEHLSSRCNRHEFVTWLACFPQSDENVGPDTLCTFLRSKSIYGAFFSTVKSGSSHISCRGSFSSTVTKCAVPEVKEGNSNSRKAMRLRPSGLEDQAYLQAALPSPS